MVVEFLQINLHHSKAASAALLIRLATLNIDVVLIQEPWIVCNNICVLSIPLYKLFYTKGKGKTRTRILTKTHLHHTEWGSANTNERGQLLCDYLLQLNLFICNKGNDPTFITRNMREVLDITLISEPLLNQL